MPVISLTITESDIQVLAGVPQTVAVTANIPSTIIYTLDGTEPTTLNGIVYTGPIVLPTNKNQFTFKVFATDGTSQSPIIERQYGSEPGQNRWNRARLGPPDCPPDPYEPRYPYGSLGFEIKNRVDGPAGITVDAADGYGIPDGYDGTATNTSNRFTDLPYNLENYDIVYSETNSIGQKGIGIGNLPAQTTVVNPAPPPENSNANSPFFNPKALVIFQDGREQPFNPRIRNINKTPFTLQNPEKVRDGALYYNTAFEGNNVTGSLVNMIFNPGDNTYNFYYFDSSVNRWIISKEPVKATKPAANNLDKVIFSPRSEGAGLVFKWIPFKGSKLI